VYTEHDLKLIREAIRFYVWAAGEGLSTGSLDEPEECLFQYAAKTGDEDYDGYADKIIARLRSPRDEPDAAQLSLL